jgi:hypothetical protein
LAEARRLGLPARLAYLRETVTRLGSSDLEAMLTFVGEAQTVESTEPFTRELLDRLLTLLPSDHVSFEEVNLAERVLLSKVDLFERCDSPFQIQSLSDEAWAVMDASPIGAY